MAQIMRITGHHSAQSFQVYNHAEATKFSAQIEAHEANRQEDRIAAAAVLAGIPLHVMRGLIFANRKPTGGELAAIKREELSSEDYSPDLERVKPKPARSPIKRKVAAKKKR